MSRNCQSLIIIVFPLSQQYLIQLLPLTVIACHVLAMIKTLYCFCASVKQLVSEQLASQSLLYSYVINRNNPNNTCVVYLASVNKRHRTKSYPEEQAE